jgi:hypothetical protein
MDLLVILTSRGFDAVQKKKKLQTQVYTIETETYKKSTYYIIRVNELPGICTDAVVNRSIPEPIDRNQYKGKILYRTDSACHYLLAKASKQMHKSISKTLDILLTLGLNN